VGDDKSTYFGFLIPHAQENDPTVFDCIGRLLVRRDQDKYWLFFETIPRAIVQAMIQKNPSRFPKKEESYPILPAIESLIQPFDTFLNGLNFQSLKDVDVTEPASTASSLSRSLGKSERYFYRDCLLS
jgi:hypothetical protein